MRKNTIRGLKSRMVEGFYSFEIVGRFGWKSKYLKETDAKENTIKFWQEI